MQLHEKETASSVAWYKLAELIDRGEKEKVLNLYRLLAYSFEDKAYALQVEGDILWAFEDKAALERYEQAAYLYQKKHKLVSAVAIYQHLVVLEPTTSHYESTLLELFVNLDWKDRFVERCEAMFTRHKKGELSREFVEHVCVSTMGVIKSLEHKDGLLITEHFFVGLLARHMPELAHNV